MSNLFDSGLWGVLFQLGLIGEFCKWQSESDMWVCKFSHRDLQFVFLLLVATGKYARTHTHTHAHTRTHAHTLCLYALA